MDEEGGLDEEACPAVCFHLSLKPILGAAGFDDSDVAAEVVTDVAA